MEKEYIQYLLNAGYSIISESTGKMIRDVGEGIEIYDPYYNDFPDKVFGEDFNKAYNYFES